MNALFDLFNDAERRTLGRLAAVALAVLVLTVGLLVRVRGGLGRDERVSVRNQEAAQNAVKARDEARVQWKLWEDAGQDLADLRTNYFYEAQESDQTLRQDIQRVFAQAGTTITDLAYSYSDLEREKARKTVVTFTYTGTYVGLLRLLATLEAFPKFLVIENVEFPRTGSGGGSLSAKLTLAGYYGI